jgi:hypothetical protein
MVSTVVSVVALVLLFGVLGPLVLYVFVRGEHDQRERMDRESAERAARRDRDGE